MASVQRIPWSSPDASHTRTSHFFGGQIGMGVSLEENDEDTADIRDDAQLEIGRGSSQRRWEERKHRRCFHEKKYRGRLGK